MQRLTAVMQPYGTHAVDEHFLQKLLREQTIRETDLRYVNQSERHRVSAHYTRKPHVAPMPLDSAEIGQLTSVHA